VVGRAAKKSPSQIASTAVNSGFTFGFTTIVSVAGLAQSLAVGVNV
jgi:hypothetical protein